MSEAGQADSREWWGLWWSRAHRAGLQGTAASLLLMIAVLQEQGPVWLDVLAPLKAKNENPIFT